MMKDNFDDKDTLAENGQATEDKNNIGADIIRGHINTIILRALYERDKYGYEIINDIERKSHSQYSLKQPTLYSALKRLENQGYIIAYWKTDEVSSGGRRKYFTLTDSGREITEKNLAEWEYSRTIIDSLISDRAFDFTQPAPTPVDFTILRKSVSRVPNVRNGEDDDDEEEIEGANAEYKTETVTEETIEEVETVETVNEVEQAAPAQSELSEPVQEKHEYAGANESVYKTLVSEDEQFIEQSTTQEQNSLLYQLLAEQSEPKQSEPVKEEVQSEVQQEVEPIITPIAPDPAPVTPVVQPIIQPEPQQPTEEELAARRIQHENYLRLISEPARKEERNEVVPNPNAEKVQTSKLLYNVKPNTERDYKNLINGIYDKAIANGTVETNFARKEKEITRPATTTVRRNNNSSNRIVDRGLADGVRITPSYEYDTRTNYATKTTYNKGLTFLMCSGIVLLITLIEFIFCMIFKNNLHVTVAYPIVILLIGIVQFTVFGALYFKGYGTNCAKPMNNSYLSKSIIFTILLILIICVSSFLFNINFTLASDVMKLIVIPTITVLNIVVFTASFYLLVDKK